MTEMILLSEAQMARISPFFPLSHGTLLHLSRFGAAPLIT
jgi:hypothetical protein